MANTQGIRKLFDNIAPDYDRLNHILSLNVDKGWRRKAIVEIVDGDRPLSVLDVACGTGDFTIEISRSLPEGSTVTGIDLSEEMMKIGREKLSAAGIKAEMVQGDCEALPYEDAVFDRVAVAFGVRNFQHLDIGLREMNRVLKKGGRLVILELSLPSNPIIRWFYNIYFFNIVPLIGGWISGDRGAYTYLPASVKRFPKPEVFKEMLQNAGFVDVRHESFTFGLCRMYVCSVS